MPKGFQVDALYDNSQEVIDRKTHDFLANSNTLKCLIDFEPVKNLSLPIFDPPLTSFAASVPLHLETLKNNLSTAGRTIYHRTVAQYSDNGIVCQSYIPGFERFNIIRNGCLVAPPESSSSNTKTKLIFKDSTRHPCKPSLEQPAKNMQYYCYSRSQQ